MNRVYGMLKRMGEELVPSGENGMIGDRLTREGSKLKPFIQPEYSSELELMEADNARLISEWYCARYKERAYPPLFSRCPPPRDQTKTHDALLDYLNHEVNEKKKDEQEKTRVKSKDAERMERRMGCAMAPRRRRRKRFQLNDSGIIGGTIYR